MNSSQDRIFFLDAMRGTLMSLGVVLHSAQVFNPARSWIIHSEQTSELAGVLVNIIHTFRIPAFFVVSGFFCAMTLHKYPLSKFLRVRLVRIAVPFLATAILLNPVQALLLNLFGWRSYELATYLASDESISHLWFLINLLIYFVIAGSLSALRGPATCRVADLASRLVGIIAMPVVVLLLPIFTLAILALGKLGFDLYSYPFGIISTYEILIYVPYFLFGMLLFARRNLLEDFAGISPVFSVAVIIGSTSLAGMPLSGGGLAGTIAHDYLTGLSTWASVALCFHIFLHYFNRESRSAHLFSEASYTIYLFHHLFVIVFGLMVISSGMPSLVGLATLVIATGTSTMLIHVFGVSRSALLRFLFNGRSFPRLTTTGQRAT